MHRKRILMKSAVEQDEDNTQLDNINYVIKALLPSADIDWRDEVTVDIILPDGKDKAFDYLRSFVENEQRATPIEEHFIPNARRIIELMCSNPDGCDDECRGSPNPCTAITFLIRQLLWTTQYWDDPNVGLEFKNMLYELVIGDFG